MRGYVNVITGELHGVIHTPEEKHRMRVRQLRIAIWSGVHTMTEIMAKEGGRIVMYTLTYAKRKAWRPGAIKAFVRWLRVGGVKYYVWVAELQKRGVVHFHVCVILPNGARWVKPTGENGGWRHGFTWVTDNVRYPWYILKYCSKGADYDRNQHFPKGQRIYSVSRRIVSEMHGAYLNAYRGIHLPAWFRIGACGVIGFDECKRVAGGVEARGRVAISPLARSIPTITEAIMADMWYAFHASGVVSPQ